MELNIWKTGILITGDEVVIPSLGLPSLITRFAPAVEVPATGSTVLRIQNASGASPPNHIEVTIASGQNIATPVDGSVPIALNADIYVRVVSAPAGALAPSFLQGWFAYVSSFTPTSPTMFATLAQFKAQQNITGSAHDTIIQLIIEAVTAAMQQWMGQEIVSTSRYELRSVPDDVDTIVLRHRPVISVSSVLQDGASLTDCIVIPDQNSIFREKGFTRGRNNIAVSYLSGYAQLPQDLVQACIAQSRHAWQKTVPGGGRMGELSRAVDAGGSTSYQTPEWLPEVEAVMRRYRPWWSN